MLCRKRRRKGGGANDEAESIRPVQQTNCSFGHYRDDGDFAAGGGAVLFRSDTEALISTVRTYINYATIVFAAYSGNSVFEKWLTQGKSADAAENTAEA